MTSQAPELDVHDMVKELTAEHQHRERYDFRPLKGPAIYGLHHATTVPALIHQLTGATPASTSDDSGTGASSRPAARIEALDTLWLIDFEVNDWIYRLGGKAPGALVDKKAHTIPGSGIVRRLSRLHSLYPSTTTCGNTDHHSRRCCQRGELEHAVSQWWQQARIVTGWDSTAWRPNNTCPACEKRRTLRIKLYLHAGLCVACRATWDESTIGLLADHIRQESEAAPEVAEDDDTRTEDCA